MHYNQDYFEGRTSFFYQFGGYRNVGMYFNRLARWFRPHAGTGAVLDVGCAYGFLLQRFDDGRDLAGCDVSPWAIQQAERHLPRADFHLLDPNAPLPYADGRFSAVLCTDVLEHVAFDDQPRVLAEIVRVLAPGGRLCMTTPNLTAMRRLLYSHADRTELHIGMRDIEGWSALLARHGLRVVDRWAYLNGMLPGRVRGWCGGWLPECALVGGKDG